MATREWLKKPLFSKLEDALTYQGHSEICGCSEKDPDHIRNWGITVTLREDEVRKLMGLLGERLFR